LALTAKANIRFTRQVKENERVIAKAKVVKGESEKGRTTVDVKSYVGSEIVFSGVFDMYRSNPTQR
jgi:acyl-coenzyme A thioesterase PaaI-like protein